ncbi:MAG: dTDP-4-dehydrorhamnose 3,5-epimerase [Myxococcota bacterium]
MAEFVETDLPGVVLVDPEVYGDERGFFLETYHEAEYRRRGIPERFVQDNHSRSIHGILRGLHGQSPDGQGKLVRAIEGEVFDVAVDVRLGSPTFGKHVSVVLSAENFRQIYVPPGMVHGFVVTSDVAQVAYKVTSFYRPEQEFGVRWDDPELAIPWPIDEPVLSRKDRDAPFLSEVKELLIPYRG